MIKVQFKGLDQTIKNLKNLEKGIRTTPSKQSIKATELFNNAFMSEFTEFKSWEEMVKSFEKRYKDKMVSTMTKTPKWSRFVSDNSKFDCWGSMCTKAAEIKVNSQIVRFT